ncbi:MAG: hypothetical protein FDZ70_10855 [Actinobacteria bacterium]|nr:MAG: hypothetical protein FDZ70_10855 [Actinomycetota bacterium]
MSAQLSILDPVTAREVLTRVLRAVRPEKVQPEAVVLRDFLAAADRLASDPGVQQSLRLVLSAPFAAADRTLAGLQAAASGDDVIASEARYLIAAIQVLFGRAKDADSACAVASAAADDRRTLLCAAVSRQALSDLDGAAELAGRITADASDPVLTAVATGLQAKRRFLVPAQSLPRGFMAVAMVTVVATGFLPTLLRRI